MFFIRTYLLLQIVVITIVEYRVPSLDYWRRLERALSEAWRVRTKKLAFAPYLGERYREGLFCRGRALSLPYGKKDFCLKRILILDI